MIHDHHAHVHDPEVITSRAEFASRDPWFALQNPPGSRRLSSPHRLIQSMDRNGVSTANALAFGWRDHQLCVARNDVAIEMRRGFEHHHRARLRWFGAANPAAGPGAVHEIARLAAEGFDGVGELFPDGQGFDLSDRSTMGPFIEACSAHRMTLLVHASDPNGPDFAGRDSTGPAKVLQLLDLVADVAPGLDLVVAHLGGGLALIGDPEGAKKRVDRTQVRFDTGACAYLYAPERLREAAHVYPGRVVFGSDHPVCSVERSLRWVRGAGLDPEWM